MDLSGRVLRQRYHILRKKTCLTTDGGLLLTQYLSNQVLEFVSVNFSFILCLCHGMFRRLKRTLFPPKSPILDEV